MKSINLLSVKLIMRAKWTTVLVVLVGGLALQSGCVHQPELTDLVTNNDPNNNNNNDTGKSGCDPNIVYFENDILPILTSSCAKSGCHDLETAKKDVILNDYENIINTGEVDMEKFDPYDSKLYEEIIDTKEPMPPLDNPQLTSYQKDLIRKWIMQGAKNNRCDDECDTTNVTYSGTIQQTLAKYCVNCHSGSSPQGGIALATYNEVKVKVLDQSLLGAVKHQSGYSPMPKNSSRLPDCELKQIQIWVDNGALND